MAKRWVIGVMLFWLGLISVWADGKVFPPKAYPIPEIPEQQALIHYANGVEKLVIQTGFQGKGTNFAWVVPLPSVPKIEAATSGLFPTLQFQFRPEVEHHVEPLYAIAICLFGLIRLLWKVRPTGKTILMDYVASFAFAGGLSLMVGSIWPSLVILPSLLLIMIQVRCNVQTPFFWLLSLITIIFLTLLILPAFSTAGVSHQSTGNVFVHDRQLVGSYEAAVLSAKNADDLLTWLNDNGFTAPPEIKAVAEDYIKDGWVFAAIRLGRAEQSGSTDTHPLMFTFATAKAVYPMRLTSVGSTGLRVDLFVFGEQRAKALNFAVTRCAQLEFLNTKNYYRDTVSLLHIGHPGLSNIIEQAAVATKLEANLTPDQMKKDVWLDWEKFREEQKVLYSSKGAWLTALNWTVVLLVAGLLLQESDRFKNRLGALRLRNYRISLVSSVVGLTVLIFLLCPRVAVHLTKNPGYQLRSYHRVAYEMLRAELKDALGKDPTLNVSEWVKINSERVWREDFSRALNPYTGAPIKQEDSPGNYRIKANDKDFDYYWYDGLGFEVKNPN